MLWRIFVRSRRILNMINMARYYNVKPSDLLDEIDPYTAYCFDEACMFIMRKIDDGEEPQFHRHYNSFSELYKEYS